MTDPGRGAEVRPSAPGRDEVRLLARWRELRGARMAPGIES